MSLLRKAPLPEPVNPYLILDVEKLYNIVARRCGSVGMTVAFKRVAAPQTNATTMEFPIIGAQPTKEELLTLMGWVSHECGHHLRALAFDVLIALNKLQAPESLSFLFNMTEDDVMERHTGRLYPGDRQALIYINEDILTRIISQLEQGKITPTDWTPMATMVELQRSRTDWDYRAVGISTQLYNALPPEAKGIADTIAAFDLASKLRPIPSVMDTYKITYDLHKILYPDMELPEPQEVQQQMEAGAASAAANGEREEAKPKTGAEADKTSTNQSAAFTKPTQKQNKENQEEGEGSTVDFTWKDAVLSDHNNDDPRVRTGSIGPKYKISGGYALAPLTSTKRCVVDMSSKRVEIPNSEHHYWQKTSKLDVLGDGTAVAVANYSQGGKRYMPPSVNNALANKIRIHLLSEKRSHAQYDQEYGKLDKRNLTRLALPPIDGGNWNKKIFYTPRERRDFNTCITLLVDWSGSMDGKKRNMAGQAANIMNTLFNDKLRIPTQIATFSNRIHFTDIGLLKKYDARISTKELATRFNMCDWMVSSNNDADSLWWAYHEALSRREKRKIIIVLSDGAPTDAYVGSGSSALKGVTTIIEKDKRCELYGIGIESQDVNRYYTKSIHLRSVNELEHKLLTLLGGRIHAS